MELNNLILIEQFCGYYNIPSNFIKSLEEIELRDIVTSEELEYVKISNIDEIEKMFRLLCELNINIEGLAAIQNLLNQIAFLNEENSKLKNKLDVFRIV